MKGKTQGTHRDPDEPGGAISNHTGAVDPVTEPIPSQPASSEPVAGSGWVLGNRYRVIDRVGAGGMAEVFRAHDELLARDVAVKVFRTHAIEADTASGAERQQIELHALARLNHPNLITLFDGSLSGNAEGPTFLVMELINGPTLAARIAEGPLAEPEARELGIQIADALAYVHAEGMVHRDVKPANILLGTDRTAGDHTVRARLSDFGIVRLVGSERMTNADFTVGTASYLAPEQARGSDVGPVADVYSLGLVLIEAHTGVRSFDGPPLEAVMARLASNPDIPEHLPAPWPSLLAAMTAREPAERPSAEQVAQALRDTTSRTAPFPLTAAAAVGAAGVGAAGLGAAGLGAAAAAAGATGAAGVPAVALADAPTVGLPVAGGGATGAPPAVINPWEPVDEPSNRRWAPWLLAAVVIAALAVGGFLLTRPTSSESPPVDQKPGTSKSTSHSPSGHRSTTSGASTRSSSTVATTTATTTSAAPSTTAQTTSAAPSTTAVSSTTVTSPSTSTSVSTTAPPGGINATSTVSPSTSPGP